MSIDLDEIEGTPEKPDFRRANGAPMYYGRDGKNVRGSRPSGWGKVLDDENALVNWKIDRAAYGVAHDKALQARYAAVDMDSDETKGERKVLREASIAAGRGDEASDIGTALHAMSERWEKEPNFSPPEPFLSSLTAYTKALEALGIESLMFEYKIVNERWRSAGTVDRLYRLTRDLTAPDGTVLPAGTLLVGDLKTGKRLDFSMPGYCVQTHIYASGALYDVVADEFCAETPEVNQKWGLLVHMPSNSDTCTFLWVDLEVGEHGAYLVQQVREWRKMWRSGEFDMPEVEPPGLVEQLVESLDAEVVTLEQADAEWIKLMTVWIKARLKQVNEHDEARTRLLQSWPEGHPTPKQGFSSVDEVEIVLNLLDKIEADFSLPFVGGNPNSEQGVHSNDVNRSNRPGSREPATTSKENN